MRINIGEHARMALATVAAHRIRSSLTVLGIVIGITTVVAVASMLVGLRQGIVKNFEELGPDSIFLTKTSGNADGAAALAEMRRRPITPDCMEAIRQFCPSVQAVSASMRPPAVVNGRLLSARVPGYEMSGISLGGWSANSLEVVPRDLASGRFFTPEEERRGARVAVLGARVAAVLFPDGHPLGKAVNVAGQEYTVIGVFTYAKAGFFDTNNFDGEITIPLRTASLRYPQVRDLTITSRARPGLRKQAFDEIQVAVRRARGLRLDTPDDFHLSTPETIVRTFDNTIRMLSLAALGIASVGLLVGGIGVMNVMLVSVTERTREIGIRKAIGARRIEVTLQFLIEAMTLTGAGGVVGIVLAIVTTRVLAALIPNVPTAFSMMALASGLGLSLVVGLFFGVWPAMKAARLDPVESLRYE